MEIGDSLSLLLLPPPPPTPTPNPHSSKFPTFSNLANVKDALFGDVVPLECFLEQLGRLEDVFGGQDPGSPVDAHGAGALGVFEYVYTFSQKRLRVSVRKSGWWLMVVGI